MLIAYGSRSQHVSFFCSGLARPHARNHPSAPVRFYARGEVTGGLAEMLRAADQKEEAG